MDNYLREFWFVILLFIITGCSKTIVEKTETIVSADFESGSIGEVVKVTDTDWELYLANDNGNPDLPDNWRNWWYVKMENISTNDTLSVTLKNRGWPFYYLPVYSYNQHEWLRFTEEEVSQNELNELIITKQFESQIVWIARFYPYTLTDLQIYLNKLFDNKYCDIQISGYSQKGKPVYVLKMTDFGMPVSDKKRVFIHARTHPAETPPSFVIEGMVNFLLGGSVEAKNMLAKFEFYIFPMQNVDGVKAGNYRTTPQSENLEVLWLRETNNPLNLAAHVPSEVALVQNYAKTLMTDGGPPVSMALNLHASNSEPDIRPFFFPHFGTQNQGYSDNEAALWEKQTAFISHVAAQYGTDKIEPTQEEGGGSFVSKMYPESWWWANFQNQVMAITMEMTYGRAGYAPGWVEPDDLRQLGASVVLAIGNYYHNTEKYVLPKQEKAARITNLKYPHLYPLDKEEESKN